MWRVGGIAEEKRRAERGSVGGQRRFLLLSSGLKAVFFQPRFPGVRGIGGRHFERTPIDAAERDVNVIAVGMLLCFAAKIVERVLKGLDRLGIVEVCGLPLRQPELHGELVGSGGRNDAKAAKSDCDARDCDQPA